MAHVRSHVLILETVASADWNELQRRENKGLILHVQTAAKLHIFSQLLSVLIMSSISVMRLWPIATLNMPIYTGHCGVAASQPTRAPLPSSLHPPSSQRWAPCRSILTSCSPMPVRRRLLLRCLQSEPLQRSSDPSRSTGQVVNKTGSHYRMAGQVGSVVWLSAVCPSMALASESPGAALLSGAEDIKRSLAVS